ncbi:MAG: RimK family alpha-L-glutamate ligase [Dehalococcoidales bacterium]|nr:RimK family alpha-L-glutamate ligase [Dehalococcoidales bacterium]
MKGWTLYKDLSGSLKPEVYEVNRFIEEASENGIEIQEFKPEQFDLIVTKEDRKGILIDGETATLPNFLLPRMGANTTYFALAVIRHLERLGVHSFNSSQSIDTVKDKLFTQQILAENNLPVPNTMMVKFPVNVDLVESYLGFPVVVKTLSGSQGIGVFLIDSKSNFEDLMQLIEETNSKANIILQECISSSRGRDLRVFTIGGRVVACMERKAKRGKFRASYSRGGSVKQFDVTPEIEWLATETSRILGLDIAGIDLLFDGGHFKVCEANSAPGFEGLEKCCNVNIPQRIYDFIRFRLNML